MDHANSNFKGGFMKSKCKQIVKGLLIAIVLILAGLECAQIYVAVASSDESVATRCDAALSRDLKCFCYRRHARMCPD